MIRGEGTSMQEVSMEDFVLKVYKTALQIVFLCKILKQK